MKKRRKKVEKELKEMQEKGNKFFTEFKAFILRGNVMDMAVGVIIGGAFTGIVTALTTDIINPLINERHEKDLFNPISRCSFVRSFFMSGRNR